jgi:hypothetical protein
MRFGFVTGRIVYYVRLVTFLIQQLVIEMALWVAIKLKEEKDMEHRGMKETIAYYKSKYEVYKDCYSSIVFSL